MTDEQTDRRADRQTDRHRMTAKAARQTCWKLYAERLHYV